MPPSPAPPLFLRPEFRCVAGETLRPGGLALTRRALELARLAPHSLVAELGCGPGATARLLAEAGHRVLALDASARDLPRARTRGVLPLRADACRLPLADASLDAAFCECVLSASGRAGAILAEAARCLKSGGRLVLSDLHLRGGANGPAGAGGCLAGALEQGWLLSTLEDSGFAVPVFEDHSRLLAELAARLVLSGLPAAELSGGCGGSRPGYFLCIAQKAGPAPGR